MEAIADSGFVVGEEYTNLFDSPPNVSPHVEYIKNVKCYPVSSLESGSIVEINIPASDIESIIPWRWFWQIGFKVTKKNGTNIEAGDAGTKVNIESNIVNSFFEEVAVFLNDVQIETSNGQYSYGCDIDQKLTYSTDAFNTQLKLGGCYLDEAGMLDHYITGKVNTVDKSIANNKKAKERAELISGSKEVTLCAPFVSVLSSQKKMLPTGVSVKIRIVKAKQEKILKAADGEGANFACKLTSVILHVKKVKLTDTARVAIETLMRKKNYTIQIERTFNTYHNLPANIQSQILDNIYQGVCPSRTAVVLLSEESFRGSYTHPNYHYQHFKLQSFKCCLDNETELRQKIEVNVDQDDSQQAYLAMLETMGIYRRDKPIAITPEMFKAGVSIF